MKITRFKLPAEEAAHLGLKQANMNRLGRIVAIAGRNGSGKSRLLQAVEHATAQRNQVLPNIDAFQRGIANSKSLLATHPNHENASIWAREMREAEKSLEKLERLVVDRSEVVRMVRFVPKKMDLRNPLSDPPDQTLAKFQSAKTSSMDDFPSICLAYIQQSQNRWWNATHPQYAEGEASKQQIIDEFSSLQELLNALLGIRAQRSADGAAQMFGRNLADANLSEGQKVLLQLAVAIHAQRSNLSDAVFVLDELENHLHPSVAIDILDKISEVAPEAQIWLATHSIPLLAHIMATEPASIWYVDQGEVVHAGRKPELVLNSLLGDEGRVGQLHAFTSLPAQLAAINYAAESLLPPGVVVGGSDDPQVRQVHQAGTKLAQGDVLRLLDFGAGKGRLLEGLAGISSSPVAECLDYTAFDHYASDANACRGVISGFYEGSPTARYFNDGDELLAKKGRGYFDAVVMCNVLHEIPPRKWLQLFSTTSFPYASVRDGGHLVLIEDMRIPTGECAHEHGFLVLDTVHLRTLFNVSQQDIESGLFRVDDARGDGRLKAHIIARDLFERVSAGTRSSAVTQLRDTALRKIEELRKLPYSYVNGTMHGFWTQQYANASLFLGEVGVAHSPAECVS